MGPDEPVDAAGWTPLFHEAASYGGHGPTLLSLLMRGADPNHRAKNGDTVLDVLYGGVSAAGEHRSAQENELLLRAHGYVDPPGRERSPPHDPTPRGRVDPPAPRPRFADALAPGSTPPVVRIESVTCMGDTEHRVEVVRGGRAVLVLEDNPAEVFVSRDGLRVLVDPEGGPRRAYDARTGDPLPVTPWPAPADLVPVHQLSR